MVTTYRNKYTNHIHPIKRPLYLGNVHLASISCSTWPTWQCFLSVARSPNIISIFIFETMSTPATTMQQRFRGTMNEVYFDFQDYGVMRHINIAYLRDLKKAGCTNRASETARSVTRSVFSRDEATFLWPIDPKLTLRRREANQVIISGPPHHPHHLARPRLGCHLMDCSWCCCG